MIWQNLILETYHEITLGRFVFLKRGLFVMVCKLVVCVLFCFCLAGAYRPGRGGGLVAKSFFVVHLERLTVHLG